jgi:enoyl-CoA hydratase/carnithine racemase
MAATSAVRAAESAAPILLSETRDGVGTLTLNNPARRNALSRAMLGALQERLAAFGEDPQVRVVILAAKGPVFSSGHDLNEVSGTNLKDAGELFNLCTAVMEAIRLLPKPVIAQVQGLASAAGCQLAATCDLVVASSSSGFQTPGVRIGLFCTTPAVALARAVSTKKALEMLLTGEAISPEAAERAGLVNRVVPPEKLEEETWTLARQIASFSGDTIALGKAAFYRQISLGHADAYGVAQETMTCNAVTEDAQEGIKAFLQKRPPRWKH